MGDKTETNKYGGKQSKLTGRYDLLDPIALDAIASILATGAEKYGEDNWRLITTCEHLNHALTHIFRWLANDKTENHLGNALTRLMFAYSVENGGNQYEPQK